MPAIIFLVFALAVSPAVAATIPFLLPADETFDVGMDTRTRVNDKDYQAPFRFTGKLIKLTVSLPQEKLTAAEQKVIQERMPMHTTKQPTQLDFGTAGEKDSTKRIEKAFCVTSCT